LNSEFNNVLNNALSLISPLTGDLAAGANKITGLGAGTARTDAASLATIQDGTGIYSATVGGTADAITLTPSPAITAYAAGQAFYWIASGANTTAVTLAVSGLASPKAVTKNGSTALIAGDIPSGALVGARYDGTRFQLVTVGAAALPLSIIDAAGDLIYGTAADTAAKLALGTAGQLLTVNAGATAPAWASTTTVYNDVVNFRLTLTTVLPVTTADVTAAGTLYCTPYKGKYIDLYDGSSTWNRRSSAEFSLVLTLTSGKPYDIFVYDNSTVPTLEVLVWTNDTTRATGLTLQDGVLVKTGATTRRYVGTLYASGANTTEDSFAKRYLWNYYNRVLRPMANATETTDSWSYNTATIRQANANAANRLSYVQGVAEDTVWAKIKAPFLNSNSGNGVVVGIGVDSTTAFSGIRGREDSQGVSNTAEAEYLGYPGIGLHNLNWNEWGSASAGTITWYGDNGEPTITQAGIVGWIPG